MKYIFIFRLIEIIKMKTIFIFISYFIEIKHKLSFICCNIRIWNKFCNFQMNILYYNNVFDMLYYNDVKVKNCLFKILFFYILLKYSFKNNICIYLYLYIKVIYLKYFLFFI